MKNAFIRNRAEEFGHDVWDSYILPPYFNKLGIREAKKSTVIEGGRGCGKTALLRYLSYQSQFSKNRQEIPESAFKTVGLYLKADPQYFSGFSGGGIDEKKWHNIFEHALCISLIDQILEAVNTLNSSAERREIYGGTGSLNFQKALTGFSEAEIPATLNEFGLWVKTQKNTLSRWFRNFDDENPPKLYSLTDVVRAVIEEIRQELPYFTKSVFAVFIDEYENLLDYQQQFLNTLIKSGEPPLLFHVAMKPNGMRTRLTSGTESIQEVADFRKLVLDDLLGPDFEVFAAELFFFRLIQAGLHEEDSPVKKNMLQDEDSLNERRTSSEYGSKIRQEMRRVLPGMALKQVAVDIFADTTLTNRWRQIVSSALEAKKEDLRADDFFDAAFPDASLVNAALLHQNKNASAVFEEFNKLKKSQASKYGEGEWIHHFLFGTVLLIYIPLRQRHCPVYAGFDAFTKLSKSNVRHFLELCHLSVNEFDETREFAKFNVPIAVQAEAAFRASRSMKDEVSGCGDTGNRLMSIVNFLGRLFRLSQARYSQSEPERSHFSIINEEVGEEAQKILDEAVKWSILFKVPESKVKSTRYESDDYLLNPIFAPFFGISYNKGRKLEIPCQHAEVIFTGEIESFTELLRQYEKKWSPDNSGQMNFAFEL